MLVLSRHEDESIMIGDAIEITVVHIGSDKVRIGIAAPREIAVHRKEIYDTIQAEKGGERDSTDGPPTTEVAS